MNHLTATAGLLSLLVLFSSCKKDKEEEEDNTLRVLGEPYKGGIIGYILKSGDPGFDENKQHGLIISDRDQVGTSGVAWGAANVNVTGTSAAMGSGKANTEIIVKKYPTANYAANICDTLTLNGYKDWYLPSREELSQIFQNRANSPNLVQLKVKYWTSTAHVAEGNPFSIHFGEAGIAIMQTPNNPTISVRAVRSF